MKHIRKYVVSNVLNISTILVSLQIITYGAIMHYNTKTEYKMFLVQIYTASLYGQWGRGGGFNFLCSHTTVVWERKQQWFRGKSTFSVPTVTWQPSPWTCSISFSSSPFSLVGMGGLFLSTCPSPPLTPTSIFNSWAIYDVITERLGTFKCA